MDRPRRESRRCSDAAEWRRRTIRSENVARIPCPPAIRPGSVFTATVRPRLPLPRLINDPHAAVRNFFKQFVVAKGPQQDVLRDPPATAAGGCGGEGASTTTGPGCCRGSCPGAIQGALGAQAPRPVRRQKRPALWAMASFCHVRFSPSRKTWQMFVQAHLSLRDGQSSTHPWGSPKTHVLFSKDTKRDESRKLHFGHLPFHRPAKLGNAVVPHQFLPVGAAVV